MKNILFKIPCKIPPSVIIFCNQNRAEHVRPCGWVPLSLCEKSPPALSVFYIKKLRVMLPVSDYRASYCRANAGPAKLNSCLIYIFFQPRTQCSYVQAISCTGNQCVGQHNTHSENNKQWPEHEGAILGGRNPPCLAQSLSSLLPPQDTLIHVRLIQHLNY